MKELKVGDRIRVKHGEAYPYEALPPHAEFVHCGNLGNSYDGLISVLEVVETSDETIVEARALIAKIESD